MAFRNMANPPIDDADNDGDNPGNTGAGGPGNTGNAGNPGNPTTPSNPNGPVNSGSFIPSHTPPNNLSGNNPNGSGMPGINIQIGGGISGSNQDDPEEAKKYLLNYNEKYANATPALFRDTVVDQTIAVLISKSKPNAMLVGAAGVGKTHIVEDIARRIVAGDVPEQLLDYTIYELPLSTLVSGASLVGQLEERLENILKFASDPENKAILFIDEIHQLTKSHDHTLDKVAQMLKPALARGDLHVIGATTSQEARELDNDPAFKRRFSQLIVSELSSEQTAEVLRHVLPDYTAHYRGVVTVPADPDVPGVIESIVSFADEYNRARNHRPDNAITLLDKAMSHLALTHQKMEQDGIALPNGIELKPATVEKIAKQLMTGHIDQSEVDFDTLAENFAVIRGQDHVIEQVTRIIKGRELGAFPATKPASWLFAGASGVGKTKVAEIVASTLTHAKPLLLNMAEYHEPSSINRIIGSPAGYVGSDSHREKPLDSLESNPYQVIILDEFEKAHRDVQNLFLGAFDKGVIDTASGKTIDLSKAIVIATTNSGRDKLGRGSLGFTNQAQSAAAISNTDIANTLSKDFPKELIGRFSYVTAFNRIDREVYTQCLIDHYAREYARIAATRPAFVRHLPEHLEEDTINALVEATYVPDHGVRPARRAVENWITETLIDAL